MIKASKSTVIGGAIAFVLVAGGGLCAMAMGSVTNQQDAVAKLRQKVKDKKAVEGQLTDAESKLAASSAEIQHLEQSVTQAEFVPTLLSELEKFGKQNGIDVIGVRPMDNKSTQNVKAGDPKETKPYDELNIEVKGRGTFADVQRFIGAIKAFPKIVAVRTISLQPKTGTGGTDSGSLDIVVTLRAYVFPPPRTDQKANDTSGPAKTTLRGLRGDRLEG